MKIDLKEVKAFLCNTGTSTGSSKSHSYDFYLDKILEAELSFDKLEAFSTAGDIRPPYPYQWRATTKIPQGADDPFEGLGGTPLEALRNLWKEIKSHQDWIASLSPQELEEYYP